MFQKKKITKGKSWVKFHPKILYEFKKFAFQFSGDGLMKRWFVTLGEVSNLAARRVPWWFITAANGMWNVKRVLSRESSRALQNIGEKADFFKLISKLNATSRFALHNFSVNCIRIIIQDTAKMYCGVKARRPFLKLPSTAGSSLNPGAVIFPESLSGMIVLQNPQYSFLLGW